MIEKYGFEKFSFVLFFVIFFFFGGGFVFLKILVVMEKSIHGSCNYCAADAKPWILIRLKSPQIIERAELLQRGGNPKTLRTINALKFELSDGTSFFVSDPFSCDLFMRACSDISRSENKDKQLKESTCSQSPVF